MTPRSPAPPRVATPPRAATLRRLLLALGAVAVVAPLAAAPAVAAEPSDSPSSSAPAPQASADGYPWGCDYPPHGAAPETAPVPTGARVGLPAIGGEALSADGLVVPPGAPAIPDSVQAPVWLVADLDTGEVLGSVGAHQQMLPASVLKVLLMATVLPRLNPATQVEITCEDRYGWGSEPGASAVIFNPGSTVSVEDLAMAAMLKSSNDAATALARTAGGYRGVVGTIEDMNSLARRLGAWDTHAVTPSGLDPYQLPEPLSEDRYQVTSPYDMALIFREAFKNDNFKRYITTKDYTIPAQGEEQGPLTIHMASDYPEAPGLIYDYADALGGKTGYTDLAGHTFVGAREQNGRRLVSVVMGIRLSDEDNNRAYRQAAALMDWGFSLQAGSSVGHLVEPGEAEALLAAKEARNRAEVDAAADSGFLSPGVLLGGSGLVVAVIAGVMVLVLVRRRRQLAVLAAAKFDDPAFERALPVGRATATVEPESIAEPPVYTLTISTKDPAPPLASLFPGLASYSSAAEGSPADPLGASPAAPPASGGGEPPAPLPSRLLPPPVPEPLLPRAVSSAPVSVPPVFSAPVSAPPAFAGPPVSAPPAFAGPPVSAPPAFAGPPVGGIAPESPTVRRPVARGVARVPTNIVQPPPPPTHPAPPPTQSAPPVAWEPALPPAWEPEPSRPAAAGAAAPEPLPPTGEPAAPSAPLPEPTTAPPSAWTSLVTWTPAPAGPAPSSSPAPAPSSSGWSSSSSWSSSTWTPPPAWTPPPETPLEPETPPAPPPKPRPAAPLMGQPPPPPDSQ